MIFMIERKEILEIIDGYDLDNLCIAVLGSHSALEICRGAKDEDFKTLVICQCGREKTYEKYYRSRLKFGKKVGCVDDVIILDKFKDIVKNEVQKEIRDRNAVIVPHRSFCVYVGYDSIENNVKIPLFGNRFLLKIEERDVEKNQYYLLEKSGIPHPRIIRDPSEIDCLVMIKVSEEARSFERAFFIVSSREEYYKVSEELVRKGITTREKLEKAVIEEFIVGSPFNFNFFYSPLDDEIELLGIDLRRQTNIEGITRLPAPLQSELLKYLDIRNIEVGHIACTLRESLLERVFELAEKFVKTVREEYPPGVIGPFALQSIVTPGPPREEVFVYDVSVRVPGSPGTKFTPYSEYLWGHGLSVGRRIAMEIREAVRLGKLGELVT